MRGPEAQTDIAPRVGSIATGDFGGLVALCLLYAIAAARQLLAFTPQGVQHIFGRMKKTNPFYFHLWLLDRLQSELNQEKKVEGCISVPPLRVFLPPCQCELEGLAV